MVLGRIKSLVTLGWTYLWAFWLVLVVFIIYALRGPLKITESLESVASSYFNNLTPKFYVALTGTSSLVSGIILIFEWWYFKNNVHETSSEEGSDNEDSVESSKSMPEFKVWRNPMALFRGSEYARGRQVHNMEPLTYYDMNLSAQDHQNFFCCEEDSGKTEYEIMQVAWRERDSTSRIAAAREVLMINPDCAPALVMLAEEECETVLEAEVMLKKALKMTENSLALNSSTCQLSPYTYRLGDTYPRFAKQRDCTMQAYIKRRIAMCVRKQGRLREAVKMFKEMSRDISLGHNLYVHENLIESCLEMQAYADVQALLVRFDDLREPRSAVLSYTSALLKARAVAENFRSSIDISLRKGLSSAEAAAIEAITRAIEYNPHVPLYLLEIRPMIFPPEHYLKRGDTEALSYAFSHIQHWKRIDGALQLLHLTWKGDFASRYSMSGFCYQYSQQLEESDRELLPGFHETSNYPKKESAFISLMQSIVCVMICLAALVVHHYPNNSTQVLVSAIEWWLKFSKSSYEAMSHWWPSNLINLLASRPSPDKL